MKIVITGFKKRTVVCGIEDNSLCYFDVVSQSPVTPGNVYVARVEDRIKNLDACFVRVQPEVKCFLNSGDCKDHTLPKTGELIPVRIKSEAKGSKLAVCTMKLGQDSEELENKAKTRSLYSLLKAEAPVYIKKIRTIPKEDNSDIITDRLDIYDLLRGELDPEGDAYNIRHYTDDGFPLTALFSIREKVEELLSKRVWLKSGGYLVIDRTEALCVIDVNTGKCDRRLGRSENLHSINLEAAREALRQIRLRNLSGIILIDFINYKKEDASLLKQLEEELEKLCTKDAVTCEFVDITPLYLAELTRKRVAPPVAELL